MERLIPIINRLQDVFNTVGSDIIDLPQITVVGSQSSGKSSVLESLVGHDLLPRGSGICTKRPLVLHLIHLNDPKAREYAYFEHNKERQFTDYNEMMQEIADETERLVGKTSNVRNVPITMTLYSPHVLNLTLVDLPGLTKIAVKDQPVSIVKEIEDMVMHYISKPKSLILAVSQADQDLANSEALAIARKVDPTGDRTVGVITKLDLMDQGTNARDVLENKVFPLKLGYYGVVNRSQKSIDTKVSMDAARKAEKEFFENSRDYSDFADRCGAAYLAQVLNRLLMEHIRSCLPSLRHDIQTKLSEKETELDQYGTDPTSSPGATNAFILDVITKYLDFFQSLLDGKADEEAEDIVLQSRGGARVSRVFLDDYNRAVDELSGLTKMKDSELFFMMRNHAGLTVPLFTPHKAFDMVIFRAIEQFREPSLKLVDRIAQILFDIHAEVDFMELSRFNILNDSIRAVVDECIRACVDPTKDFINGLIDNEQSYMNTARPDFRGTQAVMAKKGGKDPRARQLPEKPAVPEPVAVCSIYGSAKEITPHHTAEMKDLVQIGSKYFDLIREQIKDLVPKAVVNYLVHKSTEMLRPTMIKNVFNSDELVSLLQEDPAVTRKRIACQQTVQALRKATQILNEVRTLKL